VSGIKGRQVRRVYEDLAASCSERRICWFQRTWRFVKHSRERGSGGGKGEEKENTLVVEMCEGTGIRT